jgi:hypothetical protein
LSSAVRGGSSRLRRARLADRGREVVLPAPWGPAERRSRPGMDAIRWMCVAIVVLGVVFALSFLPGRTATAIDATEDEPAAMR